MSLRPRSILCVSGRNTVPWTRTGDGVPFPSHFKLCLCSLCPLVPTWVYGGAEFVKGPGTPEIIF